MKTAICPECGTTIPTMRFVGDERGIRRFRRHNKLTAKGAVRLCGKSEKCVNPKTDA